MKINASDYFLARCAHTAMPLWRWLGALEASWLREELDALPIAHPLFITGLARSGTTILLELLAQADGVATHRYRDFPFLATPCLWNRYLDLLKVDQQPVERAHQDRIRITADSPEAFEEPIWQQFFPHVHQLGETHRLGPEHRDARFDVFFRDHLRKVLLIRHGHRYVSKGNYNLTRLEYLLDLFPDARFIVPVRHPISHVLSLVRMHRRFTDYATRDPRVPRYLAAAGHYEFGPQRVPIQLSDGGSERVLSAWQSGEEAVGYAIQWADVYRWVDALHQRRDSLSASVLVIRYEDFCESPTDQVQRMLAHAGLDAADLTGSVDHISKSTTELTGMPLSEEDAIWEETAEVATTFGYQREKI